MDLSAKLALVTGLFTLTFILNVPFGYLRGNTTKWPLKILYIHLPIPIVFLGRMFSQLDFRYVPIFIIAALIGQIWGGKLKF